MYMARGTDLSGLRASRAVQHGGLEAHEGGEADAKDRQDARAERVLRAEGAHADAVGSAAAEDAHSHHGQDAGLGDQEHAEHLRADVDPPVAEEPDGCDGGERDGRPGHLEPEEHLEHVVGLDGEEAVDADLQAVVGDDRQDGGGQPHGLAHGQRNVGVEAAGCLDVAGHGHEADGEEGEHDACQEVAGRGADAADADGYRGHARHDGQRALLPR